MWRVIRSDAQQSLWATKHDAKHYIGTLGAVLRIAPHTYGITLPDHQHITATLVRR